jgi:hypothetical protein
MTRYAIRYTRIPTHYNDSRVAVVEAESPHDAIELLQHGENDHYWQELTEEADRKSTSPGF